VAGAAVFYILGGLGVASWAGLTLMGAPPRPEYAHFANLPANTIRIGLLGLVGLCLTIVVRRGRRLLLRALVEQQRLSTLVRFLPGEVASEILRPSSRLRPGMDLECAILFIDLRDSTRLMERMPPEQIADFLIRFRRRITRIVRQHRGIIEKFAGDGALIVFGVSDPQPDDCRRALACGRHFIKSMEEWNARRDQGAHLRLAAGIHAGRCFCGIVGDESRQEFTVLGDTVNVAARLEEIAKQRDLCLVASREILMRAGEDLGGRSWQPLGIQRIRGYGGALEIYAYHPS
jgi:adenylate cyclase